MNAKNIGRKVFFKYLGINFLIIAVVTFIFSYFNINIKNYILSKYLNPILRNYLCYSIQLIISCIMSYLIFGKVGETIINRNGKPFWTTYIGFIKLWFGIFIMNMLFELVINTINYNLNLKLLGIGLLMWILSLPLFLVIGAIHGLTSGWFISKEIELKKNK